MDRRSLPHVVLITDPAHTDTHIATVIARALAALPRGELAVLLRDRERTRDAVRGLAMRLRAVTRASGAALVVRGDVDLAREVEADAVHLPDPPSWEAARAAFDGWISAPAHSDEDVARAAAGAVDAVLVSPVFATPGKGSARGVAALAEAARIVGTTGPRVFALGGVDAGNAASCARSGAYGVAAIRALLEAADPGLVARALYDAVREKAHDSGAK